MKLRKVWRMFQREKLKTESNKDDEKYEEEGLMDDIKKTLSTFAKMQWIFDAYIPTVAQDIIFERMVRNEENDTWSLPCLAYSGNNIEEGHEADPLSSFGLKKIPTPARDVISLKLYVLFPRTKQPLSTC